MFWLYKGLLGCAHDEVIVAAPDGARNSHGGAGAALSLNHRPGTATVSLAIYDISTQNCSSDGQCGAHERRQCDAPGNVLEIRIADGRATLSGGVAADGQEQGQGRVQGLFVRPEDESN